MIYHIVQESDFLPLLTEHGYYPANFQESGFVHCALEASVISVANDYYSDVDDRLLLLKIDPLKLSSQTRFEPPEPVKGISESHMTTSSVFPHVYGPIEECAVEGVGLLERGKNGYAWPQEFVSLSQYINRNI